MYRPSIRVRISYKRMLQILKDSGKEDNDKISKITSDRKLRDFFGCGRCSTCANKNNLTEKEITELNHLGIDWENDGMVCLSMIKESNPGIYLVGEF